MKPAEAEELCAYYAASYGQEVSKATRSVWIATMTDVSPKAGRAAVDALASAGGYPPTPQAVRKIALELTGNGSAGAWENLMRQIESIGTYRHSEPQLDDKTWRIVNLMGGWTSVCLHDPTKPWFRNEFERLWDELPAPELVSVGALPGRDSAVGEIAEGLFDEDDPTGMTAGSSGR